MQSLQGVTDMLQKQYQRKLTIIVSADVAGYTRLTELNEIDIHSLLQKRLQLVREHISNYDGQVLRIHGDGCLCSFDSTVSALKACLEIQQNSNLLNSNEPVNNQIWFRIGIHLSEVIFDNSEPYGNGVNIAVRLQQKAEPGEILISKKTVQSLDNTHSFLFSKFKKLNLKNISNSISVCKLLGNGLSLSQIDSGIFSSTRMSKLLFAAAMVCLLTFNVAILALYYGHDDEYQNHVIMEEENTRVDHYDYFTVAETVNDSELIIKSDFHKSEIVEDAQNNQHLSNVIKKVEMLSSEFRHLRDEINSDDDKVKRRINAAANIMLRQEQLLERLLNEKQQDNFMLSNMNNGFSSLLYANQQAQYPELMAPDYMVESLDSLDKPNAGEVELTNDKKNQEEYFGCLSCINNKDINQHDEEIVQQNDTSNKTAVLVGSISGDGARVMGNKSEIVEDYLYEKLQNAIQQSRLGVHIDSYTRLSNAGEQKIDDEYIQSLCQETNAVLVASYELMTNYWAAEGTYLRFHHCENHKSMVMLEKNLAPTIMNVDEPYLTKDNLLSVDKSVDYMIDKLVLNQADYL